MSGTNPLNYFAPLGEFYSWPYGGITSEGRVDYAVQTGQQGQPINQLNKRVNGKYPPGGDWIAWRRTQQKVKSNLRTTFRPGFGRAYHGSYVVDLPVNSPVPLPTALYTSQQMVELVSKLEGFGAEGYARARPAKPDFSLATTLFETKDFPGMFKQSIYLFINRVLAKRTDLFYSFRKGSFFRKKTGTRLSHTAEWYLSINFGWLPIIQGITDYMEASAKNASQLKQLLKDEGRPITRRRTIKEFPRFADSETTGEDTVPCPSYELYPQHVTQCYPHGSPARRKSRLGYSSKVEFVGKFRYWLPPGPRDFPWTARLRRRMLGSRVTPSVAWNLMPWTFLLDYFSTLGKAIENLGPGVEDQLITEYCYVTYREDIVYEESHEVLTKVDYNGTVQSDFATHITASRLRMRVSADPFAFRFTGLVPSLKQSAIIIALATK